MTLKRGMALLIVTVLTVPAMPVSGDETIRCESRRNRYQYCPADTENEVELKREMSRNRCVQWRTWGWDNRGVWVDRGCRAEFEVGDDGMSGGAKAAIIGGVAAAVIAGILIAKKDDQSEKLEVPEWAVGMFRGWDEQERSSIELTIGRDGTVAGWWHDQDFTGRWQDDRVNLGRRSFRASRQGEGLLLREVNNDRHRISLWREY
jgi:hypothetical protein